jgi:hypothetical protein
MNDSRDGDPGDDDTVGSDPDPSQPDVVLDTEAEVQCPFCGQAAVISLDSGGGAAQEYVEDCPVCCRPWRVRVRYDDMGAAQVWIEPS